MAVEATRVLGWSRVGRRLALAGGLSLVRGNVLNPEPAFVGLDNYRTLVGDGLFWLVVRNNVLCALGTIPITMALALATALLVNRR